jgi:hypothetical protein
MRIARGIVVSLVLLAAWATNASASVDSAGGYKFASKQFTLKANKTERLSVACPAGTHVYGGGQSNPSGYDEVAQLQEYPIDGKDRDKKPDDGFEVLVQNRTSNSIQSTVWATCGKPKASYRTKKTKIFAGSFTNEIDATCKSGTGDLVGGGVGGPKGIVHDDGGPLDPSSGHDYYYAYMHNSSQETLNAEVYSICAHVHTTLLQGSEDTAPALEQTELTFQCPANTVALDGGLYSSGGVTVNTSLRSTMNPRNWIIFADNTQTTSRQVGVLVACGEHP